MKKTESWLKSKTTTAVFAVAAFLGGLVFLNQALTGNIILNNKQPFGVVSFVGLLLILCSIVLALYSIKKKNR